MKKFTNYEVIIRKKYIFTNSHTASSKKYKISIDKAGLSTSINIKSIGSAKKKNTKSKT